MKDPFRMEILQATENLFGKVLGNIFVELAMLKETAANRTARDVFKEAVKLIHV
jgi:hypothetical protein